MNKYYNTKTKELERVARELRVMQSKGYAVGVAYKRVLGELYGRYQGEAEYITMTGRKGGHKTSTRTM